MNKRALLGTVIVVLGALGVALNALPTTSNPSELPVAAPSTVLSSALYCTGLTSSAGGMSGSIDFVNTLNVARTIALDEVATGTTASAHGVLHLAPWGRASFYPGAHLRGSTYAVSAQVNGGGVVAEQDVSSDGSATPCVAAGTTHWYAAGLDTTVGSSAILSVYNPTATDDVYDVTTTSGRGYGAPTYLQGLTLGSHREMVIDLSKYDVNTANIGVALTVVHGNVAVTVDQVDRGSASLVAGQSSLASSGVVPLVSTSRSANSQLRVSNPSGQVANISVDVHEGNFVIAPQKFNVAPYATRTLAIAPNTAIPPAQPATLFVTSSTPVAMTLVTGTQQRWEYASTPAASSEWILNDVRGQGFAAAAIAVAGAQPQVVRWQVLRHDRVVSTGAVNLHAGVVRSVAQLVGGRRYLVGTIVIVSSAKDDLVASATLASNPSGIALVNLAPWR